MRPMLCAACALLVAPLAGCVAGSDDAADPLSVVGDLTRLLPYLDMDEEHDHTDPAIHDAGWNLASIGWTPLSDDPAALGRYNQVDVHGALAFVGAYALPPDMRPGMAVVDISEPAHPVVVGRHTTDFITPIDVHVSEDGRYAALAGHRFGALEPPATLPAACTTVPVPGRPVQLCPPFAPGGVELIDLADPTRPAPVARWMSAPSGAHTVKLATIGGALYAFAASYGFSYADRLVSGVEILRHDADAPGGFAPVARFLPDEPSGGRVFVHDVWVEPHPATGATLLYVAYWDGGVLVVDVSDPGSPVQIAAWDGFDRAEYGNVHFVRPMPVLVDGHHYTVAAPEYSSAEHAGRTYVLDTTDPTAPALLSEWHLPGDPLNPGGYLHSPHNFDLTAEGLLVMGHYHAGVWALDLRPVFAGADAPDVIAYRFVLPPVGAEVGIDAEGIPAPNVWNASWLPGGRVVASDIGTGLHFLEIGSAAPGAPPYAGLVEDAHDA